MHRLRYDPPGLPTERERLADRQRHYAASIRRQTTNSRPSVATPTTTPVREIMPPAPTAVSGHIAAAPATVTRRSDERGGGNEGVITGRYRWAPLKEQNKKEPQGGTS